MTPTPGTADVLRPDGHPAATAGRIALLGGTFDPVHNAHLALAEAALAVPGVHAVRFVPAGLPWQKASGPDARAVTLSRHRVAMLELAISREPRFAVERIELDRAGPSYTLDTVRALAAAEPGREWLLVIGADQYARLHTWHGWRELLDRVTLAVAQRPGIWPEPAAELKAWPHRVLPLPLPPLPVSATDIRRRVAAGESIIELVPPEVARYIERNGLYLRRAPSGS